MKRIPAKALLVTIVIILVLTSLIFSLMLYYFYQQQAYNNVLISLQLTANNEAAIQIMLNDTFPATDPQDSSTAYDLYHNNEQVINIKKFRWGNYIVITSIAKNKHLEKRDAVLIGNPLINDTCAFYLADHGSSIVFTGDASIVGNCFIPRNGFKTAYFEGLPYEKNQAIIGTQKQSTQTLPAIDTSFAQKTDLLLRSIVSGKQLSTKFISEVDDSVHQSFFNNPRYYYNEHEVVLKHSYLKGQIVVASLKSITVYKSSRLQDVILIAPVIICKDGVEGAFQAFASDTLIIEKNAKLLYPSCLSIQNNNSDPNHSYMRLDSNASISGSIVTPMPFTTITNIRMEMAPTSLVTGSIYWNGMANIQGKIIGELLCDKIYANTKRGYYLNYLFNAELNRINLHPQFVNHCLINNSNNKKKVKWLY